MKINRSKIYYISVVFFLTLHAKLFLSAKLKTFKSPNNLNIYNITNTTKAKNDSNKNINLEKNNIKNDLNLGSNSFKKLGNSNTQKAQKEKEMDIEKDELEKASSNLNDIKIEENLPNEDIDFITKLNFLEKIVTENLLLNSKYKLKSNLNFNFNNDTRIKKSKLIKKNNQNLKIDHDLNKNQIKEINYLIIDNIENIYYNELLNIKLGKRKFVFYNILSLVMLTMVGVGVLGILFILFFSYNDENYKILK